MSKLASVLCLGVLVAASPASGAEKHETNYGPARLAYREFKVTGRECLALIAPASPRQAWKCVFRDNTIANGFSFNQAYEHRDSGFVSSGPSTRLLVSIESHPNGGSIGFTDPDPTHPGYSRVIPFEEVRALLTSSQWSDARPVTFSGTYLVVP